MAKRDRTNDQEKRKDGCANALFWFTLACLVIAALSQIAKMAQN